jgi:hypothetical protein
VQLIPQQQQHLQQPQHQKCKFNAIDVQLLDIILIVVQMNGSNKKQAHLQLNVIAVKTWVIMHINAQQNTNGLMVHNQENNERNNVLRKLIRNQVTYHKSNVLNAKNGAIMPTLVPGNDNDSNTNNNTYLYYSSIVIKYVNNQDIISSQ